MTCWGVPYAVVRLMSSSGGGFTSSGTSRHVGPGTPAGVDAQLMPDAVAHHRPVTVGIVRHERVL